MTWLVLAGLVYALWYVGRWYVREVRAHIIGQKQYDNFVIRGRSGKRLKLRAYGDAKERAHQLARLHGCNYYVYATSDARWFVVSMAGLLHRKFARYVAMDAVEGWSI